MRIETSCPVCHREKRQAGISTWEGTPENGHVELQITTDPVVVVTCFHGHRSLLTILDPSFTLLFERGLQRLSTSSTRDAVVDAYTALEMYLSHVPTRARFDREKTRPPAELRKDLSQVVKLAERSLGAALAVVSLVSGSAPPTLQTKKTTELRNSAVHAGVHPSVSDA